MERTLIIFKPDCMEKRLIGKVLDRLERAGFKIIGCRMLRCTPELLRKHYAHVADRPFYPGLEKFMSSTPVIAMALQGDKVVSRLRELLGPTDSRKAPKGTIRGDFGTDNQVNVLHASDSPENGLIEIARFFKADELF
ncbi:MAG: nucleoside-diphosphate kinase [Opitutaceae bacterium]|jgi:nucleoside-diphosphate kinase